MNNTYFIAMLKSILFNQVLKASEIAFGGCVLCEQPKIKFECENTIQYIGCLFVCKTANISQISAVCMYAAFESAIYEDIAENKKTAGDQFMGN